MHTRYKESIKKLLEMSGERKLIFYGMDALTKYVYQDLLELGEDVVYFISEELVGTIYEGKEIKSKYDLLYEDRTKIFIIGFVFYGHAEIYKSLTELGFEFEKDFWLLGLAGYAPQFDAVDSLLGYNRYYRDCLGFDVYGEITDNSYLILVLGGSTTDSVTGAVSKCWCYLLYEKLVEWCKDVVVVNGGMGGYSVCQEFNKFIRDGLRFNPKLMISFDGLNNVSNWISNVTYPHLMNYQKRLYDYIEQKGDFAPDTLDLRNAKKIVHGLEAEGSGGALEWFNYIRKMHAICEEFGIEYISFLQPLIKVGNPIITEEHWNLLREAEKELPGLKKCMEQMQDFYKDAKKLISGKEYIYDLTSIFNEKEDMYYDFCHNTQSGHEVIAQNISEIVKEKLCVYME